MMLGHGQMSRLYHVWNPFKLCPRLCGDFYGIGICRMRPYI